jgi:hypothetical protein
MIGHKEVRLAWIEAVKALCSDFDAANPQVALRPELNKSCHPFRERIKVRKQNDWNTPHQGGQNNKENTQASNENQTLSSTIDEK